MSPEIVLKAHLFLSSRFENIEIAERTLVDLCRLGGCNGDDRYWLVTAMREAVANAIQHGNQQQPERDVRIEYSMSDCEVRIRIEDDGQGFDPEAIPDPTADANLLQPSGRGIFYMRRFMTSVEFSRATGGGTAVTMARRLQPETRSSADEE